MDNFIKAFGNLLIVIAAVLLIAMGTRPTEQQCRQEAARAHIGGLEAIATPLGATAYVYQVQDHLFYRSIYVLGQPVGYGAFGTVFLNK